MNTDETIFATDGARMNTDEESKLKISDLKFKWPTSKKELYLLTAGSYVSRDHLTLCDAGPQSPRVRTRGIYLC